MIRTGGQRRRSDAAGHRRLRQTSPRDFERRPLRVLRARLWRFWFALVFELLCLTPYSTGPLGHCKQPTQKLNRPYPTFSDFCLLISFVLPKYTWGHQSQFEELCEGGLESCWKWAFNSIGPMMCSKMQFWQSCSNRVFHQIKTNVFKGWDLGPWRWLQKWSWV